MAARFSLTGKPAKAAEPPAEVLINTLIKDISDLIAKCFSDPETKDQTTTESASSAAPSTTDDQAASEATTAAEVSAESKRDEYSDKTKKFILKTLRSPIILDFFQTIEAFKTLKSRAKEIIQKISDTSLDRMSFTEPNMDASDDAVKETRTYIADLKKIKQQFEELLKIEDPIDFEKYTLSKSIIEFLKILKIAKRNFSITGKKLVGNDIKTLMYFIALDKTIVDIHLMQCEITVACFETLAKKIQEICSRESSTRKFNILDLSANKFGNILEEAARSLTPYVDVLELPYNGIEDSGILQLQIALAAAKDNCVLHFLDLSNNRITFACKDYLYDLVFHTPVQHINLTDNPISLSLAEITTHFRKRLSYESSILDSNTIIVFNKKETLYCGDIFSAMEQAIAYIENGKTEINLSKKKIYNKNIEQLSVALDNLVKSKSPEIITIDLSSNLLTDSCLVMLWNILYQAPSLKNLNLSGNTISYEKSQLFFSKAPLFHSKTTITFDTKTLDLDPSHLKLTLKL